MLTDRIDLDDQISKTFIACGLPNPTQCGSVAALREAVTDAVDEALRNSAGILNPSR